MILRDILLEAARRLERHHTPNPRLSAEVLIAHCLSVDRAYLYTHDEKELTPAQVQRVEEAIHDRVSGVPVQYIVGRQEFYGRYFAVSPAVLIPRPETEFIVETVLQLKPRPHAEIIDVGTGSGCVGLTLALELPTARVTISDVSIDALNVAAANARELQASANLVCMDLLDAVGGPFDYVVSNPPYIRLSEAELLPPEVREHEPHVALFAENDGLALFRRLIPRAEQVLTAGGYLIMEMGYGMEAPIFELLGERWEKLPTRRDLQGIPRTIVARLRSN